MVQVSHTGIPSKLAERLLWLAPRLVNLLLLSGIGWLVYPHVLPHLAFANQEQTETVQAAETAITVINRHAISYQQIADWHLFGESVGITDATPAPADAPETKLNLTLRGTFASKDMHHGLAIIQNNDQDKQQYFTLKQVVFGLATLEEIHEGRVILKRAGRYETLILPKKFLSSEHFLDSAAIKAEKKRVASRYRDIFLSRDGMELIKLFGFRPLHRNGGFLGFTITALADRGREMMAALGVMEGDLITVVNGMRLSESLEAVASLKELKTATSIDVIIERDGNEIPFYFELDPPPPELAGITDQNSAGAGTDGSGGTAGESAEDLGDDWVESDEYQIYIDQQRARTTGSRAPVLFDH